MARKRVLYYDALKILASFFVILIHVTAEKYYLPTKDLAWYINWGYNALSRWAVPVFCMVTGALMLSRELKIWTVIKKNVFHIAILLLFWGMYYWIIPTRNFTLSGIWSAFTSLISGNAYSHLWYLYMLLGFYLVSPLISIITKNSSKRVIEYFLLLLLSTTIVIPYLSSYFPFLRGLLSSLKFCFIGGEYLFYFLAGYYLSSYPWKKWIRIVYSVTGIATLVGVAIMYCGIHSMRTGKELALPVIVVAFASTSIFILFQLLEEPFFSKKPIAAVIRFMAPLTFGIYLLHFRVEKILLSYGIDSCIINPLVGAILVTLAIYIITTAISFVISKIPLVKRLIQ